ncbi:SDR family NAD(P)-dependent oxidoreductase [Profundibacterium mesophilum]|uniref:Sulfite reductase flavoprotein alpha-component n=1 Tax=Profundibacterium mesophilum KAUST100406-0324 TaxID=1037889 RepID=A0A921NU45_9RHOB|nr:SDR family NAD(P)-dependent oxidoreductase [Profundibacterium mesophilum]KAF0675565.1 sulfite reductase flavoprotein alpha-component [Profundibacterium mesophilum KAUST100406-0324]
MTRSILITGCSSGIGRDAAVTLKVRGWRVFAGLRRAEDARALEAEHGLETVLIDLADPRSIETGFDDVLLRSGGTLDALFNNAAYAIPGAIEDMPVDALRAIFETNFFGWHDLTRRAIPVMRRQGHGRIVMNSSVLGMVAAPWRGAYNASKFALEGLTDTLRVEMRDTPVHVVTIAPGPIRTPFRRNSVPHFERWIDWRASPRAAQYESALLPRLYAPPRRNRFELMPAAVTRHLLHALEAPHPRPRYHVTVPTHAMGALRRILPVRALDAILSRG